MKTSDQYHKWVEWSEEDQTYLGKCPDLITGIHGDDPRQVYAELCDVLNEVIDRRGLPVTLNVSLTGESDQVPIRLNR